MASKFKTIASRYGEKGRLLKVTDTVIADVLWTDKESNREVYNFACFDMELEALIRKNDKFCGVSRRNYNGTPYVHIGIRKENIPAVKILKEVKISD